MTSTRFLSMLLAGSMLAACATTAPVGEVAEITYGRTAITPPQAGDTYYQTGHDRVKARGERTETREAKNVIIFIGDGMGVSTVTAGRIYAGQKKGLDGESYQLAMEKMPNVALSKTYSNNAQISDSAATATAIMSGVKVNARTLGISKQAPFGDCDAAKSNGVETIFEMAETEGMATGIVSTARITHATPAATYAKSASRNWEDDSGLPPEAIGKCADIASQLIAWPAGDGFEVAMGGGRGNFLPKEIPDPEYDGHGRRLDARNLVEEWKAKSDNHKVIFDSAGFAAQDFTGEDHILGLFEPSHMQYELDRAEDAAGEPSLAELTKAAITRLSQDGDGYVLLVEGGRVDHAHHDGNAKRALEDVVSLDDAIAAAVEMTGTDDDTLIIVTADHSHTFTISGYADRGNPILGLSTNDGKLAEGIDGKPYTTLGYQNGPGAICTVDDEGNEICEREDLTNVDTEADDYLQQSVYPLWSETHGGEDVAIFATGPGSELVGGVMEENEIFHVMTQALGLTE